MRAWVHACVHACQLVRMRMHVHVCVHVCARVHVYMQVPHHFEFTHFMQTEERGLQHLSHMYNCAVAQRPTAFQSHVLLCCGPETDRLLQNARKPGGKTLPHLRRVTGLHASMHKLTSSLLCARASTHTHSRTNPRTQIAVQTQQARRLLPRCLPLEVVLRRQQRRGGLL